MAGSTPAPHRTGGSHPAPVGYPRIRPGPPPEPSRYTWGHAIKIISAAADEGRVSTPPPPPYGPGPGTSPDNQWGGVNQFGTPTGQYGGAPQFGAGGSPYGAPSGQTPYGWAAPAAPQRSRPFRTMPLIGAIVAVVLLVAAGIVVRNEFFPSLSAPIALPASVAGLTQGTGSANGVTVQTKDDHGRTIAVAMYADNATRPTQFAMITARRAAIDDRQLSPTVPFTTIGKLHCSQDLSEAQLAATAPGAAQNLAGTGLTVAAICWRSSRNFAVVGIALTAAGTAQPLAMQATADGWRAR